MARWLLLLVAFGLALSFIATARRLWSETIRGRADRAAYLSLVLPLLAEPRMRLEPSGFSRLAGRYAGHAVDLQAVPDSLTFRKLPALWLLVSLTEPQPLAGETRIMLRPSGLEPFSTFARLPAETAPPPGFPAHCVVRTTAPGHPPPARVMAALAGLFEDPALKEVVLSPAGLRLVRLAEEAPRGAYLLFREADLGRTAVPAATVQPMLETLIGLARELARADDHRVVASDA
ncbi:MAG: hypothetical protein AB7I59_26375 [Geminicoccaceae bacterium]